MADPVVPETATVGKEVVAELRRARGATRSATLIVYHRDGAELVLLQDRAPLVLGREAPAGLIIDDRSLSRQHVRFELIDGDVWVEDLGSTNGVQLNGESITRARLRAGDEASLGAVLASLHQPSADDESNALGGHDRFIEGLAGEAARARLFRRPFVVAMVKNELSGQLTRWLPALQRLLRPVDRVASYGPEVVELLLPESGASEIEALARQIGSLAGGDRLVVGAAIFPAAAASPEALLDAAVAALREANGQRRTVIFGKETSQAKILGPADLLSPVFVSQAMRDVLQTIERVADATVPILISGETGTGKEVVARIIHERSGRSDGALCAVNCAAIPAQLLESTLFGHEKGAFTGAAAQVKGVFEAADEGTVFLDEIGELSAAAQATLLRVLETKRFNRVGSSQEIEVDVRVVAATHRDLERMCEEGTFRWDLLYRLNTITLPLPPLRQRQEEIRPLVEHFLARANRENKRAVRTVAAEALSALESFAWPGNARELKNAIDRAVVVARDDEIRLEDLPEKVRRSAPPVINPVVKATSPTKGLDLWDLDLPLTLKERQQKLECGLILAALDRADGSQTEAAKMLGMPLRTLVLRIKSYGIKKLGYGFSAERDAAEDDEP